MFCQFCGTAIPAGGSNCPKCGSPAMDQPAPAAGPPNAFAPPPGGNWAASPVPPRQGSSFPWLLVGALGCVGLLVVVGVLSAIMVPALTAARKASRTVDCRNGMKQIGVYFALYESKFRDYPTQLRDLWRPDLATDPNLFICPVNGQPYKSTRPPATSNMKWEDFAPRVGIEYLKPPPESQLSQPGRDSSRLLVAWESRPHPDGQRTVLYYTGRVETVDDATFQESLKARREWR